jgi:integrase/recombinase XerC
MDDERERLRVERAGETWVLAGDGFDGVELVNEFLGYLVDRNYAPLTVRAYAYDLLHFGRWMAAERLSVAAVNSDVLLRYLRACRTQVLAHQHGDNVFSIRDGRSAGYAPRTVNRRLAALSGLFTLVEMRDPQARSPMPPRGSRRGSGQGCLGIWRHRRRDRGCGCVSRGGCRAACVTTRSPSCWRAF